MSDTDQEPEVDEEVTEVGVTGDKPVSKPISLTHKEMISSGRKYIPMGGAGYG